MAEQADLDATLARLEAALAAASRALSASEAIPDLSGDLAEVQTELSVAQERIDQLETEAKAQADALKAAAERADAAEDRARALEAKVADVVERPAAPGVADDEALKLRETLNELSASVDELRSGAEGAVDASLKAEVSALRAARELDMAEMQALLSELEPMLEQANA